MRWPRTLLREHYLKLMMSELPPDFDRSEDSANATFLRTIAAALADLSFSLSICIICLATNAILTTVRLALE